MKKTELKQIIKEEISKILNEGKQVGPLYHYTQIDNLERIIKSNKLKSPVSFTRFKKSPSIANFTYAEAIIVIDGDKLSNNYKIGPYHDLNTISTQKKYSKNYEFEERVDKDIENLDKYITKIIFLGESPFIQNNPFETSDVKIKKLLKNKNIPFTTPESEEVFSQKDLNKYEKENYYGNKKWKDK